VERGVSTGSPRVDAIIARVVAGAGDLTADQFAIIAPLMKKRAPRDQAVSKPQGPIAQPASSRRAA
jgi:hypothetical protein